MKCCSSTVFHPVSNSTKHTKNSPDPSGLVSSFHRSTCNLLLNASHIELDVNFKGRATSLKSFKQSNDQE